MKPTNRKSEERLRAPESGWWAAALFWLVLVAASLLWNGFQTGGGSPAGLSVRRWPDSMVLAHLLFGTLGLAAIGMGHRHLRRSREALMASEERYRLISAAATDYVFSSAVTPDGRLELQWVAGAFEKITGFSFEEYVARGGWRAMVHPDDRARDGRDMEELRANRPQRSELRTIARDGTVVWVEIVAHPVWDGKENRLAGIYGAVRDISRRKQAEAETKATFETLNQFIDSVPAFGSFVDNEERYQFVNRYYEDWFHRPRDHFVGRKLAEVHRPDTYATMRPHSRRALDGQYVRYEHEMTGRDGKYYCFDVQYIPRHASDGAVLGYFTLVFDVTERVLRDRQVLRTQRLESVGRLASGIAHDLNNILSPVLMGSDLLLETIRNPEERKLLDLIKASTLRGAAILRQLLMFGRGEPEVRVPLHPEPLVRDMLKIIEETFPKSISVRRLIAPDLPAIQGNLTHLHQILLNLCLNARDAMPDGGSLTLSARIENVDDALAKSHGAEATGPHVVFGVEDTGAGIPRGVLDKIFDPFFTTKPQGKGTGLGLSTVMGIVRNHRGFIRVDSQPGRGTLFRVYLPVYTKGKAPETGPAAAAPPKGRGEWILLVDDEEAARQVARQTLEQNGYHVLEARNGQEALSIYEQDPARIHLLLTDIMMPGMDGPALLHRLRQTTPGIKSIAMTGGLSQPEAVQALEAETARLILKPLDAGTLLSTVRHALDS